MCPFGDRQFDEILVLVFRQPKTHHWPSGLEYWHDNPCSFLSLVARAIVYCRLRWLVQSVAALG